MNRKIRSLGTPSYSFSAGFWLKNRILIKHYQLIITLESTIFECKMNQQIISIKGKNIEISYYSQDEIMLMCEFT